MQSGGDHALSLHGLVYATELDDLMRFFVPEWKSMSVDDYKGEEQSADLLDAMERAGVSAWLVHEQKFKAVGFKDTSKADMRARRSIPISNVAQSPLQHSAVALSRAPHPAETTMRMTLSQRSSDLIALLRGPGGEWNTETWKLSHIKVASKNASTFACLVENVHEIRISDNHESLLSFLGYEREFEFVKKGFKCSWEKGAEVYIYQLYTFRETSPDRKQQSVRTLVPVDSIGDAWIVQLTATSDQRGLKDVEAHLVRNLAKKLADVGVEVSYHNAS